MNKIIATIGDKMDRNSDSVKKAFDVLRQERLRRKLHLNILDSDEYWVGLAKTKEELAGAFSILHDCYVEQGIMDPHSSGLRCNLYQSLPYTSTIIIKHKDRVVGTVALIKDSLLGFPSDKSYNTENNFFRRRDYRLVEASALAVHKDYRGIAHKISFPLMKYAILYSIQYMNSNMMIATVHPRAKDFYAGLFNFQQNGEIVKYEFAKGALAIHLTMELDNLKNWMEKTFLHFEEKTNFYKYMFEKSDSSLHFPIRTSEAALDIVMTPDLLTHFFVEKTDVFKNATKEELASVKSAYLPLYEVDKIPFLREVNPRFAFRYPTRISAAWISRRKVIVGSIFDITGYGTFFYTTDLSVSPEDEGEIVFNVGEKLYKLPSIIVRINGSTSSHYPQGVGIKFKTPQGELIQAITGGLFTLSFRQGETVTTIKKVA